MALLTVVAVLPKLLSRMAPLLTWTEPVPRALLLLKKSRFALTMKLTFDAVPVLFVKIKSDPPLVRVFPEPVNRPA